LVYGSASEELVGQLQAATATCQCDLAIDADGLKLALDASSSTTPILSVFITATSFHSIMESYPNNKHRVSALFSEVNPRLNVRLANIILPMQKVKVLYTDQSAYLEKSLNQDVLIKTQKENLLRTTSRLGNIKAIVAVPDSDIWNSATLRVLIMSLYDQGKVVIGFSKNLVNAGSIASLYFEKDEYFNELKRISDSLSQDRNTTHITYPTHLKISVNKQVARSLNIIVPDEKEIMDIINREVNK
jgi:hypothetical protein